MPVELLDLIAAVIATLIMCQSNGVRLRNNWYHKTTKIKANQNEAKSGRVLTKKATTTSAENLDKAVKECKWLGDIHINLL